MAEQLILLAVNVISPDWLLTCGSQETCRISSSSLLCRYVLMSIKVIC